MCDMSVLAERVLKAFSGWRGYAAFSRVLEEFPDLEVWLAGGAVRNLLLDPAAQARDFDTFLGGPCVTQAIERLAQTGRIAKGVYGNMYWSPDADEPVQADLICIASFKVIWLSENMVDVLRQFDFTGNAIAVNARTGAVLDPQNGARDLQRRIMRAIRFDYPDEPIVPGHVLRRPVTVWFRILHYAAALGLHIEPVTMRWLLAHRPYREYRDAFARQFKVPHPNALLLDDRGQEARQAS